MLEDLKTKLKEYKEDDSGTYSFYQDLQYYLNNNLALSIKELERIPKMLGYCKLGECVECDVHREIIRRRIIFLQTKLNKE